MPVIGHFPEDTMHVCYISWMHNTTLLDQSCLNLLEGQSNCTTNAHSQSNLCYLLRSCWLDSCGDWKSGTGHVHTGTVTPVLEMINFPAVTSLKHVEKCVAFNWTSHWKAVWLLFGSKASDNSWSLYARMLGEGFRTWNPDTSSTGRDESHCCVVSCWMQGLILHKFVLMQGWRIWDLPQPSYMWYVKGSRWKLGTSNPILQATLPPPTSNVQVAALSLNSIPAGLRIASSLVLLLRLFRLACLLQVKIQSKCQRSTQFSSSECQHVMLCSQGKFHSIITWHICDAYMHLHVYVKLQCRFLFHINMLLTQ